MNQEPVAISAAVPIATGSEEHPGLGFTLEDLLREMVAQAASDLHLVVGSRPNLRIDGRLRPLYDLPEMDQASMELLLLPLLDTQQRRKLNRHRNLEFSLSISGLSRFRASALWQRGTLGAVFRAIPPRPLSLEELGMPDSICDLASRPRGLVILTGPTGSGKSTTLAAMVDHINSTEDLHIVTIEDPIEFVHRNKRCIVRQRELGSDARSFAGALRHVLRQDPDVILVGEMRDLKTIRLAITAAETGHLVLATLHTSSAPSTIDRIIDVFPPSQQSQIRLQLANTLEGVVCQTLIPRADGRGRACAMEIMLGNAAVRNLIREGKTHQLAAVMESSTRQGMQTLNQSLVSLVQRGMISVEAAASKSGTPDDLAKLLLRVHKY